MFLNRTEGPVSHTMDSLNKTSEGVYSEFVAVTQNTFLSCMAHVYTSKYEVKWLKCFTVANEAQAMPACIHLLGGLKV